MKILLTRFSWQPKNIGGAEISADQHAIELSKLGHQVKLVTNYPSAREYKDRQYIPLPGHRHLQNVLSFLILPLVATIYRPDIINAHSRSDQVSLSLTKWLHKSPVVWKDAGDLRHQIKRRSTLLAKVNQRILVRGIERAQAIYTLNNQDKTYLQKKLSKLYGLNIKNKISVIPSDICFSDYNLTAKRLDKPRGKLVIGFVGRLEGTHKGLDNLLLSLEGVDESLYELWVVGGGHKESLMKKIAANNAAVRFFGPQQNVSRFYRSFDIFVAPSTFEGWGKVIKEAMYFGLPVIGTNTGGIADQITHLDNGYLIDDNSPKNIAEAINKMLSDSPLRKSISNSARVHTSRLGDFKNLAHGRIEPLLKNSWLASKKVLVFYPKDDQGIKTGVAYYTQQLVDQLKESGVGVTMSAGLQNNKLLNKTILKLTSIGLPIHRRMISGKYDVVIYPNFYHHIDSAKSAVVVHDLGYLHSAENLPSTRPKAIEYIWPTNSTFLKRSVAKSVGRANVIIAVSKAAKKEIEDHYRIDKDRVIVTPIPPPSIYKPPVKTINDRFIYFQATIEPRKNHLNLLEAYAQLPKDLQAAYRLVLGGGDGWKSQDVYDKATELQKKGLQIELLGYIDQKRLVRLYQSASIYVQPSHYEGFGMPLLEAMACDTVVLASDIAVFREVAGDAATYFDKDSPEDIAKKIEVTLNLSHKKKEALIKKGRERVKFYRNDSTGVQELLHRLIQDI